MPVNILDIPAEKKHASKTPSFLFWGLGGSARLLFMLQYFWGSFISIYRCIHLFSGFS